MCESLASEAVALYFGFHQLMTVFNARSPTTPCYCHLAKTS